MQHQESGDPIELVGFVTAVVAPTGGSAKLYLHVGERTFQLELPIGDQYPLRVRGRLTPGNPLPVFHAESIGSSVDAARKR